MSRGKMIYQLHFDETWTDEEDDFAQEVVAMMMDQYIDTGAPPSALIKAMAEALNSVIEASGIPMQ